jgi:hypothetical protein
MLIEHTKRYNVGYSRIYIYVQVQVHFNYNLIKLLLHFSKLNMAFASNILGFTSKANKRINDLSTFLR